MIHNPDVNQDLQDRGVRFLFSSSGRQLIAWDELTPDDIVVVPAFGTTLEIQASLAARGLDPYTYNTTCPFVERVWKRSAQLGTKHYTVVVHGKATHEETRATFSHSVQNAPTVVVLDLTEAQLLGDIIRGEFGPATRTVFLDRFGHKCSPGFDPDRHLADCPGLESGPGRPLRPGSPGRDLCRHLGHPVLCDQREPERDLCTD